MENVANLVDMLGGSGDKEKSKEEILLDKFENQKNTRRSFELKVENDDDDEIFIVHEEDEEDQGSLFVEGNKMSFED